MFSVGASNDDNVGHIDMKKLAQAYSNLIIEEQQQKRANNTNHKPKYQQI
jgi:hypothetical protein